MRTKRAQHRERLLLLLDLQKNSGLNRDDGEAPRAQTSDHAAEERKTDTPWSTKAAAHSATSRESNPTRRKKGEKEKTLSFSYTSSRWPYQGMSLTTFAKPVVASRWTSPPWLGSYNSCWGCWDPAQTLWTTGTLTVRQESCVFTKLPAGSGCLIQINGNRVP